MTYEEMERSMEFIIQQMGRIESAMERYNESMLQQQAKFASDLMQLKELGKDLAVNHIRMQNAIAELAASHKDLERRLAESHESLAESQKRTDERISTFLSALERRFGGNGRGPEST
jgi:septal ring factor EnvC (AmiA/AmiB activator)